MANNDKVSELYSVLREFAVPSPLFFLKLVTAAVGKPSLRLKIGFWYADIIITTRITISSDFPLPLDTFTKITSKVETKTRTRSLDRFLSPYESYGVTVTEKINLIDFIVRLIKGESLAGAVETRVSARLPFIPYEIGSDFVKRTFGVKK